MAIKITVKEFEAPKPIPEGLYNAYVKEVSEGSGDFGEYIKLAFIITDGEQKDTMRTVVASKKLSRSKSGKVSKLYGIVKALTGSEPLPDEDLDIEILKGKPCKIFVKNDKEKDGIMYQTISEILPS